MTSANFFFFQSTSDLQQFLLQLFICSSSFQLKAKPSSLHVCDQIRGFISIFSNFSWTCPLNFPKMPTLGLSSSCSFLYCLIFTSFYAHLLHKLQLQCQPTILVWITIYIHSVRAFSCYSKRRHIRSNRKSVVLQISSLKLNLLNSISLMLKHKKKQSTWSAACLQTL